MSSFSSVKLEAEQHDTSCTHDTTAATVTCTSDQSYDTRHPSTPRLSATTALRLSPAEEEELGGIRYQFTSLEDATLEAKASQKPIFCIEVYIPGDLKTGKEVLLHPLIVEAAETLFVSMQCRQECVSVNVPGQISYTTLRVLDGSGVDLVKPVKGKLISVASVASAMIDALAARDLHVPTYLSLLEEEYSGKRLEGPSNCLRRTDRQAVFGTPCSDRSEAEFACLNGVLATRAAYYQGQHVVQVTYDTTRLSYCSLVRRALQRNVARTIFYQSNEERTVGMIELKRLNNRRTELVKLDGPSMNKSVDPKHSLRTTMLRFVPLTELQSTRANRLVSMGAFNEAMHLLSPRQGQILMRAMQNPSLRKEVVDVPITVAWTRLFDSQHLQSQ